ncbi:MAG TPA: hypothetical protein VHR15_20030 [Ktedonobacterales bacterium]|jgi:hypothetical protein|nr:hypothetical protein [Ktedonobacterales bacterium]
MSSSHLLSSRRDHGRRDVLRLAIALPVVALLVAALAQTAFASGPGKASVIVTPASGPAGTRVTVTGAHFTPNTPVTIGYSKTDCTSGVIAINGTDQTTGADGSVTVTVVWPSTDNGKYFICVTEKGTGKVHQSDTQFEALSASAASINITQTVRSAGKVTVTGANYLPGGSSFEVLYGAAGSNGCANSVATGTVNADGTFTVTFDAPFVQADTTYQVTAVSPAKTCGAGAILAASKSLTVTAAATITPTATPKPVPSPNAITFPGIGGGPQTVILCLAGLLALLILLLLLLVFARGRRKSQPVTIQERNTVTVGPGGPSTAGSPQVQRDIYAQDPRGRQTRIATEQTSVEEEPYNP